MVSYDAVPDLDPSAPTGYLDFAGNAKVRTSLREHLGDALVSDVIVGVTHQEPAGRDALSDPRTSVFFAPDQMRKRTEDWGREELDRRFAVAWKSFAPAAEKWVDVIVEQGPEALQKVWLDVLAGQSPPRVGHVLAL